jgi:hypothetical protein
VTLIVQLGKETPYIKGAYVDGVNESLIHIFLL